MPLPNRNALGAFVLASLAGFGWAAGWLGPRRINGCDVTAALETNSGGVKPDYRRAHAKGLCFIGDFVANGNGRALTSAQVLQAGTTPCSAASPWRAATRWPATDAVSFTRWR